MNYWLMKSEPSELSIDDLIKLPQQTVEWFGVRNYQARNFMKSMQVGDLAIFWHSSCKEPGIYGIVEVVSLAHPDGTQFDINSKYYDPKATFEKPIWWCVDVRFVKKTRYIPISELRALDDLADLLVLRKGNRLSVTPVDRAEFKKIDSLT